MTSLLAKAARWIRAADAFIITAGAGMGVDSGLPDFRGNEGFWKAYPPFKEQGLSFIHLAQPRWFYEDPARAWGFYGHRLNLYRDTTPHEGFQAIRRMIGDRPSFVFTSNVDGQFQKAGWEDDHVVECHGSIHHFQCTERCSSGIWSAEGEVININEEFRATGDLPRCPVCGNLARPNIVMFGDGGFQFYRTGRQHERMHDWIDENRGAFIVVLEMGAGTAIPSVRMESEMHLARGAKLVRINPREPEVPGIRDMLFRYQFSPEPGANRARAVARVTDAVGIAGKAKDTLLAIEELT